MKSITTYLIILCMGWSACAQQLYMVEVEPFQQVDLIHGSIGSSISVPERMGMAIMAGTYNKEGLGKYLVFNGSHLRIESFDVAMDGDIRVLLRREDGRDFFDKFPLLKARLTPVVQSQLKENSALSSGSGSF